MLKNYIPSSSTSTYQFVFKAPSDHIILKRIKSQLDKLSHATACYSITKSTSTSATEPECATLSIKHVASTSSLYPEYLKILKSVFFTLQLFDDSLDDDTSASNFFEGLRTAATSGQVQSIDIPVTVGRRYFMAIMKCALGVVDLKLDSTFASTRLPFLRLALIQLFDDLEKQSHQEEMSDKVFIEEMQLIAYQIVHNFKQHECVIGSTESLKIIKLINEAINTVWLSSGLGVYPMSIAKFHGAHVDDIKKPLACFVFQPELRFCFDQAAKKIFVSFNQLSISAVALFYMFKSSLAEQEAVVVKDNALIIDMSVESGKAVLNKVHAALMGKAIMNDCTTLELFIKKMQSQSCVRLKIDVAKAHKASAINLQTVLSKTLGGVSATNLKHFKASQFNGAMGEMRRVELKLSVEGICNAKSMSITDKQNKLSVLAYQIVSFAIQTQSDPFQDGYKTVTAIHKALMSQFMSLGSLRDSVGLYQQFIINKMDEIKKMPVSLVVLNKEPEAVSAEPSSSGSKSPKRSTKLSKSISAMFSKSPKSPKKANKFVDKTCLRALSLAVNFYYIVGWIIAGVCFF